MVLPRTTRPVVLTTSTCWIEGYAAGFVDVLAWIVPAGGAGGADAGAGAAVIGKGAGRGRRRGRGRGRDREPGGPGGGRRGSQRGSRRGPGRAHVSGDLRRRGARIRAGYREDLGDRGN